MKAVTSNNPEDLISLLDKDKAISRRIYYVKISEPIFNHHDLKDFGARTGCTLCYKLLKYNAVPLATLSFYVGCSIFALAPTYKAAKAEAPFRRFND